MAGPLGVDTYPPLSLWPWGYLPSGLPSFLLLPTSHGGWENVLQVAPLHSCGLEVSESLKAQIMAQVDELGPKQHRLIER